MLKKLFVLTGQSCPTFTTNQSFKSKVMLLLMLALPVIMMAQPATIDSAGTLYFPNFNDKGEQLTRFSTLGDAVDAHDGEIAYFNGTYYLYGTSYDCGFQWGNKEAPFCGFKSYSSKDLVTWKDEGFLFDAQTPLWQTRCDGNTYGCFRPHVIYNAKTKLYVLWINVYDNQVGYRVFTSNTPTGPFEEQANPVLAINKEAPVAGLNNGDHDTFIDDDGTAYMAYTDWRTDGTIVIEKLSPDYLTGTGEYVKEVTNGKTEAPGLFKRNGIYYVVYSDPNCGYCSATGASYRTATSPLGPWSAPKKISNNSCGGQPSFVSTIKLNTGEVYIFGSDLWNNAAKNEALANYFWAPLEFDENGAILPIKCESTSYPAAAPSGNNKLSKKVRSLQKNGFTSYWDIGKNIQRSQSIIAPKSGQLRSIDLTTFQTGNPNAGLTVTLYKSNKKHQPIGKPLTSITKAVDSIGWSAKQIPFVTDLQIQLGQPYVMVLSTAATEGIYGFEYNDSGRYKKGESGYSKDHGKTFSIEKDRTLKFNLNFQK